ncbi:hypothetical protein AALP_AA1G124600 [Arabis alpina]|uniref:Sulfite exporter TauE/SafE family protein n=1 Tax=Arabis alpina TaxID=50452 RepID=A0A087HMS7_ARAAL|nr:hypothetical protein AALP_AA1G124600 [Arabis alpina]
MEFSFSLTIAASLSFLAASISSAGGIGGGGLFISIMTIVAGLEMKTASSFSAFMVTGVSVANVGVGVICNRVFPNWLVTSLFAVFLAWSTMKTCKKGVFYWRLESERDSRREEGVRSLLMSKEGGERRERRFPWKKLGVLVIIWLLFFFINLFRGNKYGQGIISIKPCGALYWLLSSLQIPLTIFFTLWICFFDNVQSSHTSLNQDSEKEFGDDVRTSYGARMNKFMLPVMALLAGVLGGLFGIGGGMLISPLLLQIGFAPEVNRSNMFFHGFVFFINVCNPIPIIRHGTRWNRCDIRYVGIVMALSTVLMTTHGALNVWDDFVSGRYMGFKLPC